MIVTMVLTCHSTIIVAIVT